MRCGVKNKIGFMLKFKLPVIIHDAFEVGITLKALHAVLQITGSIFLFTAATKVGSWLELISGFELKEDPGSWIANYMTNLGGYLTQGSHYFPAIYLLVYGILNLFLAFCLWRKKLWAYPLASSLYSLLVLYQIYRFFTFYSGTLLVFTLIDISVIMLTVLEYKRIQKEEKFFKK